MPLRGHEIRAEMKICISISFSSVYMQPSVTVLIHETNIYDLVTIREKTTKLNRTFLINSVDRCLNVKPQDKTMSCLI